MFAKKIILGLMGVAVLAGGMFWFFKQNIGTLPLEKATGQGIPVSFLEERVSVQPKKDTGEMTDEEIFTEAGPAPFDVIKKEAFFAPRNIWVERIGTGYSFFLPPAYEEDTSHGGYVIPDEGREPGSSRLLQIEATTSPKKTYRPKLFEDYNKSDVSKTVYLLPHTSPVTCEGKIFTEERVESNSAEMEAIHIRRFVFEKDENLAILTFRYSTAGYGDKDEQKIFAEQNEKLKCDILSTFELIP